jgi:predicted dithiol-disulfide oxidoreductase (DUF899 family)
VSLPQIVSRERWLEARRALLAEEKAHTRARDRLSAARRELPMVRVEEEYVFEGPEGQTTLVGLFGDALQLVVAHFMFDPAWEEGCPSCSAGADEVAPGLLAHLAVRDTRLVFVSRAPLAKIEAYRARKGWTFPWYSSHGTTFNHDFGVTIDEAVTPLLYNFRTREEWEAAGKAAAVAGEQPYEMPGTSVFLRRGDEVFHTYSSYGRGAEWTGGSYAYLDLTPLGRQEDWEEPKGRAAAVRDARPDFAT